jgi:rRNA-processing protein FCF1
MLFKFNAELKLSPQEEIFMEKSYYFALINDYTEKVFIFLIPIFCMKKVVLDTNFILSCVKNKLDFFDELSLMGIRPIIPQEVLSEIVRLKNKKTEAQVAFALIDKNPSNFDRLTLSSSKGHVDKLIIDYVMEHEDVLVATLDKEMKEKLAKEHKKVIVIRGLKKLEVI